MNESLKSKKKDYQNILQDLMKKAIGIIRKFYYVKNQVNRRGKKIQNVIAIDYVYNGCGKGTDFFKTHPIHIKQNSNMIEGDVLIFVDIFEGTGDNEMVLAAASMCQLNQKTQIPEVGKIGINIRQLEMNENEKIKQYSQVLTIVHEIFHILGFNSNYKLDTSL
jgi:hypothetical protein